MIFALFVVNLLGFLVAEKWRFHIFCPPYRYGFVSRKKYFGIVMVSLFALLFLMNTRTGRMFTLLLSVNAPIDFYGIVLDENGKPLSDVEVSWEIVKAGSFVPGMGLSPGSRGNETSDRDGRFRIHKSGSTLSIKSMSKAGYHQAPRTGNAYSYGDNAEPHKPDSKKPERYIMIKDGSKKSFKAEMPLRFDWDGQPKEFKIALNGREETMIIIPEIIVVNSNPRRHEWKVTIRFKNGELAKGEMGDARLAPKTGYISQIVLERDVGEQWGKEAKALMYVQTNDGYFGELIFNAHSDRDATGGTGRLDVRWNTEGGRAFQ